MSDFKYQEVLKKNLSFTDLEKTLYRVSLTTFFKRCDPKTFQR